MKCTAKKPCIDAAASEQGSTQIGSAIPGAGLQGKLALRPREAAPLIGVGYNAIYDLCHREDFPAIRVGSSYIIPVDALRRWLNVKAEREKVCT